MNQESQDNQDPHSCWDWRGNYDQEGGGLKYESRRNRHQKNSNVQTNFAADKFVQFIEYTVVILSYEKDYRNKGEQYYQESPGEFAVIVTESEQQTHFISN